MIQTAITINCITKLCFLCILTIFCDSPKIWKILQEFFLMFKSKIQHREFKKKLTSRELIFGTIRFDFPMLTKIAERWAKHFPVCLCFFLNFTVFCMFSMNSQHSKKARKWKNISTFLWASFLFFPVFFAFASSVDCA